MRCSMFSLPMNKRNLKSYIDYDIKRWIVINKYDSRNTENMLNVIRNIIVVEQGSTTCGNLADNSTQV